MSTNADQRSDLLKMLLFVGVGLVFMFGIVLGGFYAEAYINPWLKGKPDRYGQTVLRTPHPVVVEPNPQPTAPLEEVLNIKVPAPADDRNLTVRNGLVLWLRADAVPEGIKHGDLVAILPDASPQRNDARQIYPASRPRYAQGELNGKDALYFDGKESYYYYEDVFGVSPATVYAVWARKEYGGQAFQRLYSSGAFGVDYENAKSAPPGQPQVNGIYFSAFDPKGDGTDIRDAAGQVMAPPQTPILHKNVSPQPVDLRRFMIGRLNQGQAGMQAFMGHIAEFLLFNRALSEDEQKQVETYLNKKYNLDAQAQ
jgi:hypothetical protein